MIKIKNKPLFFSIISLIAAISMSAVVNMTSNKTSAELPPNEPEFKQTVALKTIADSQEMRAIWVPFMSLNMNDTDYSESAFKAKFDDIVAQASTHNFNALIVQVRSHSDAFYPSQYFPWSHFLSGEQGKNPGFDPLNYMIKVTHDAGLQFHAWINPLRIQVNNTPPTLCDSSIFHSLKNSNNPDDIILENKGDKYLNPSYPIVRELIINGVKEIVEKYPVDGIQFDDYFYPENAPEVDKISYENYCNLPENTQPLDLNEWRFANINSLISGTYNAIKSINPNVVFGVSPSGNLAYNKKISADVVTWCQTAGYIDYICPQIYFSPEHPILPSAVAAVQWKNLAKHDALKFYFGLAVYKAGSSTADFGTWKNHDDILKTQVQQFRQLGCDGFMFFSVEDLKKVEAANEIKNVVAILKQ